MDIYIYTFIYTIKIYTYRQSRQKRATANSALLLEQRLANESRGLFTDIPIRLRGYRPFCSTCMCGHVCVSLCALSLRVRVCL